MPYSDWVSLKIFNGKSMSNPWFRFKHFTIYQERSGMKVGTDGVLLGAWVDVTKAKKILDVGTGTGLIALMLAQRSRALVTAIEPSSGSYEEARQNFMNAPWVDRLVAIQTSFQDYVYEACQEKIQFELVVSNPPYYKNSKKSPDRARTTARHNMGLSFLDIVSGCSRILSKNGRLAVIYPSVDYEYLVDIARSYHFFPVRVLKVIPKPGHPEKRVLIEFRRTSEPLQVSSLTIETGGRHQYSEEYKKLTRDFYLGF